VLKHLVKKGIVVLAGHPSEEMKIGTLRCVWKQAGLE
jgi:predicted RNA binding protein YcfA (HicA-like mRNA interferase family)